MDGDIPATSLSPSLEFSFSRWVEYSPGLKGGAHPSLEYCSQDNLANDIDSEIVSKGLHREYVLFLGVLLKDLAEDQSLPHDIRDQLHHIIQTKSRVVDTSPFFPEWAVHRHDIQPIS